MRNLTKNAIKESFIKLLNEKPLSEITVKAIANDCEINRNTFYYHYQDIPAIIEEIVVDEFEKVLKENPTIDNTESGILAIYKFAEENRRAIYHIYNSVNRNIFEDYLWKLADSIVRTFTSNVLSDVKISKNDERLLMLMIKSLSVGLALEWLNRGMTGDVVKDVHRICEAASGTIERVIANCAL